MMDGWRILEERVSADSEHFRIPIRFDARSRVDLAALAEGSLELVPAPFFEKDYDAFAESTMREFVLGMETRNWVLLAAFVGGARVGGLLAARDTPGLNLLENLRDHTAMLDVRVEPAWRGRGVGGALVLAAQAWARSRGDTLLTVETQDTNPGACRFYHSLGMRPRRIVRGAYAHLPDEAQLIWELRL
ncbi:MAG: GNAT family N-acetyltransferase [Candidatus Sumerlaeia bacterium]|nr:GNAT family N-acetyltransferase [Candidatus Sumerlaeia bacterium]